MSTPTEPTIEVLTAPARIRNPTSTTNARNAIRAHSGPTTNIARPPIRLSLYCAIRTLSGMIMTAKNETSEVSSRLYTKMIKPVRSRFLSLGASISRLICASDSSPDIARIEWPKAITIPSAPNACAEGR